MRKSLYCILACLAATSLAAQGERPFPCPAGANCSDDKLQVSFDSADGPFEKEVASGATVNVIFAFDVVTENIQGWSIATKHDMEVLQLDSVATDGADFLEFFNGGFNVSTTGFGGPATDIPDAGFAQAVVLSFGLPLVLPVRDNLSVGFGTYTVKRALAAGEKSLIEWANEETATSAGSPPVEINLTVAGGSIKPNNVIDAAVTGAPVAGECDIDWGFFFGTDTSVANVDASGDAELVLSIRNMLDSTAFELAVKNDGGSLSFVAGEIGDGPDNLRDLIITDINGISQTNLTLNTATISDVIGAAARTGVTEEAAGVNDFFSVQLAPLVGDGFFAGFVADLSPAQSRVIPATGTDESCPTNPILLLTLGDTGGPSFSRGDVNADEKVNVTDAVLIVHELFDIASSAGARVDCAIAYDSNDDGTHDIADAVFLLEWIFRRGDRPEDPFLRCGSDDETPDLGCNVSNCPG